MSLRNSHASNVVVATLMAITLMFVAVGTTSAAVIEHAMGTTAVAYTPQRVVTLGQGATEAALALGVTPVGAVASWVGDPWYPQIADEMNGVTLVGGETQPDLETIARLKPDLIIGSKLRHQAIYNQLSAIAPTVFAETIGMAWKENLPLYANAMGKEEEGLRILQAWEDRIADFKAKMGDRLSTEVSIVRFGGGEVRIYTTGFPGSVIREAGLKRPKAQQVADWDSSPQVVTLQSMERILEIDGDVIFVMTSDWWSGPEGGSELEKKWVSHPLWRSLKAARSGDVHHVNEINWNLGGGILSANRMLDDLFAFFLNEWVIAHAMGTTIVPASTERVVVLDNGGLDNVLALGIKPVGATTVFNDDPFPSYIKRAYDVEGIANVGTIDQPSLERIARLRPDLILGSRDTHEAIYNALSQIAPTVLVPTLGATWKENLSLQAEALGIPGEGEELLARYDARLEELRSRLGDRLNTTEISVLRARSDHTRAYLRQSFSGGIIEDAGLPRPPSQRGNSFMERLGAESIPQMDGDVILWFSRDPENSLLQRTIVTNPLWAQLDAVKNGRVHQVDWEAWLSGLGITAANLIVDDLFEYVAE